jgi:predicted N-acetyltransferase YhbS
MLIERIPEWHMTAADEAEIADLLARCFPTDFGGRSFFTHHHHLRLVVRQGGRIVGHMALVWRSVDLGSRRVTVAGLAEVATDPGQRGKGIAAALLQAAIEDARNSPAEFLLLFGVARVYAGAGFRVVANEMAQTVVKGTRVGRVTGKSEHLMVLPLRDVPWPEDVLVDLRGPVF